MQRPYLSMFDRLYEIRPVWEVDGRRHEIVDDFEAELVLEAWARSQTGQNALRRLLAKVDRCEIGWGNDVVVGRTEALIRAKRLFVLRLGGWSPPGVISHPTHKPQTTPPGGPPGTTRPGGGPPPGGPPGTTPPGGNGPPSTEVDWIEIVLLDPNNDPVPNEAYQVTLPDGSVRSGHLDEDGFARLLGIDPGGMCQVRFPKLPSDGIEPA